MIESLHVQTIKAPVLIGCLILFILCSCERGEKADNNADHITKLIEQAAVVAGNGNPSGQILFIDSSTRGKNLSVNEKAAIYGFKCDVYTNQINDSLKAMQYADSMLFIIENAGVERYKTQYGQANYHKGDVLLKRNRYSDAYSYYYKAWSIEKTNFDSCMLGEYSFRLALVLYHQSRFSEAAKVFKRSFSESGNCPLDFIRYYRMQQVLDNVGLSFYKEKNYDSALSYYQKGLSFIEQYGKKFPERQSLNEIAKAVIYGNMADIYRIKGDAATAKTLLQSNITTNTKPGGDYKDAQYSQVKLAEVYADLQQTDSMYVVLSALRKGLDTVSNSRAEMDWNRLIWRYYNKNNDPKKAYAPLVKYIQLRDSLEQSANRIKSTDLSQQIKSLEDQYQIQTLQKQNELKKIYLWVSILAILVAILFVFLILRNLSRSKKNITLLQSLNEQVNDQKIQLQTTLHALEEKNKQQDRILRAVAHDLRGPTATISMLCDLVQQEVNANSRAEMIGFIRKSCNNSLELISEILEAADQSGKKEQEKALVNLNALIINAVELLKLKASEKQQVIETDLPSGDVFLMINSDKINRVINNLVNNSIKFSSISSKIKIKLTRRKQSAIISVTDSGIGIPDEIKDKVFDMFTEAKRKGTSGELPYGLGLSICKQIVEAHNGNIWFENNKDRGTIFYVELPL